MNNFERITHLSLEEMAEDRIFYDEERDLWVTDAGRYYRRDQALWAEKRWLSREVSNG